MKSLQEVMDKTRQKVLCVSKTTTVPALGFSMVAIEKNFAFNIAFIINRNTVITYAIHWPGEKGPTDQYPARLNSALTKSSEGFQLSKLTFSSLKHCKYLAIEPLKYGKT